ncbi:MAG: energy transducer TonB [Cephaloticoccus sp.]|nr:energy transducer TonB [Cephaloticoccus sp.]MCF7759801.1 energy transducer TonB [Cephaloticoccus sp.]
MHKFKLLVSATLASAVISTSAFAGGSQQAQPITKVAQPVKAVTPSDLPRKYLGETIRVCMTIDEAGRASNIEMDAFYDRELARSVIPAVAQWKFKPAVKDGQPVSQRVILPIEFVAGS